MIVSVVLHVMLHVKDGTSVVSLSCLLRSFNYPLRYGRSRSTTTLYISFVKNIASSHLWWKKLVGVSRRHHRYVVDGFPGVVHELQVGCAFVKGYTVANAIEHSEKGERSHTNCHTCNSYTQLYANYFHNSP